MQKKEIIQISEVISSTHHFVYKNKKYPFNLDLFKCSSKFFSENQFDQTQSIDLVDKNTEDDLNLSEEIIQDFIKFVHHQPIGLDNENVSKLHYLANRYEIPLLIDLTEKYIKNHKKDVMVQILIIHQNDSNFDTKTYEDFISNDALYYIKNDNLLSLNFTILYRILSRYEKNSKTPANDQLIEFYFKCLDKYGKQASILFENVDFANSNSKYLKLLMNDYSQIFDFHYINPTITKSMFKIQNELLLSAEETEARLIEQEEKNKKLREEIERLKSSQIQKQEEQNLKIQNLINEINNLKIALKKQQNEQNKKMTDEVTEMRRKYDRTIENMQKEIKRIDETKEQKKQYNIIQLQYKNNDFNGIFRYLTSGTGVNIHDNGTVNISSNSINEERHHPKNLVDYHKDNYFLSLDNGDAKIYFDFKDKSIQLSSYSIKSYRSPKDLSGHLRSWVIEASNDGFNWQIIDRHDDDPSLNENGVTANFRVQKQTDNFYRFIQLRQTGPNWHRVTSNYLLFNLIEFYGKLKILF